MPTATGGTRFLSHTIRLCYSVNRLSYVFEDPKKTFTSQSYIFTKLNVFVTSEELKSLVNDYLRKKCARSDRGAILHLAHQITVAWYLFNYLNCIASYPWRDNSSPLCRSVVSESTERVLLIYLRVKRDEGDKNGFLTNNQTTSLRFFLHIEIFLFSFFEFFSTFHLRYFFIRIHYLILIWLLILINFLKAVIWFFYISSLVNNLR